MLNLPDEVQAILATPTPIPHFLPYRDAELVLVNTNRFLLRFEGREYSLARQWVRVAGLLPVNCLVAPEWPEAFQQYRLYSPGLMDTVLPEGIDLSSERTKRWIQRAAWLEERHTRRSQMGYVFKEEAEFRNLTFEEVAERSGVALEVLQLTQVKPLVLDIATEDYRKITEALKVSPVADYWHYEEERYL
jgi:hypothetical protein